MQLASITYSSSQRGQLSLAEFIFQLIKFMFRCSKRFKSHAVKRKPDQENSTDTSISFFKNVGQDKITHSGSFSREQSNVPTVAIQTGQLSLPSLPLCIQSILSGPFLTLFLSHVTAITPLLLYTKLSIFTSSRHCTMECVPFTRPSVPFKWLTDIQTAVRAVAHK